MGQWTGGREWHQRARLALRQPSRCRDLWEGAHGLRPRPCAVRFNSTDVSHAHVEETESSLVPGMPMVFYPTPVFFLWPWEFFAPRVLRNHVLLQHGRIAWPCLFPYLATALGTLVCPTSKKKPNLEEMLTKFISVSETRFQNTETVHKNQQVSIQGLETQIGQLAKLILERPQGSLPSNTETNPRE
ncbi:hypothetical protein GOBAR_AA09494 [Gossypium barbadense]|uniref:Uncharacterized protein n=1 Tax=Gossypium barbadense TaxID=3634 RepID=A0A2P5Y6C8_GOSBA|nr:hypothetical protein GOBAR_AA09494 [Gossypium barbadense]